MDSSSVSVKNLAQFEVSPGLQGDLLDCPTTELLTKDKFLDSQALIANKTCTNKSPMTVVNKETIVNEISPPGLSSNGADSNTQIPVFL